MRTSDIVRPGKLSTLDQSHEHAKARAHEMGKHLSVKGWRV